MVGYDDKKFELKPLQVKAYLTEDQRHSKYLIKGLTQLRDSGEIDLEFRAMPPMWKNRFVIKNGSGRRTSSDYPWSPELVISDGMRSIRVAIDLQDWTHYFSNHSISNCSLIYKRALEENEVHLISKIIGMQVLPFGPNHNESLEDPKALNAIAKASKNQNLVKALRNPGKVWSRLANTGKKEYRKDAPRALTECIRPGCKHTTLVSNPSTGRRYLRQCNIQS